LRPHDRHSAHVPQTYRPARRAANRSIEFSSNPAFDLIERTMTVLTWYSSLTPFSFWKENYVSLQQENEGAFHRPLLTSPNVQSAPSSYARQPFDGYCEASNIPTNSARISAVTACVSLSGALVKPITSDLHGFTARTSPRLMSRERDTAVQPPMGANCRTLTLPTCRQDELVILPTDANPSPMHRERDTAVQPPTGAYCRTLTPQTQVLALATIVPTAHATPTALSPTKADADGKP
jgi:hypothetical protein